MHAYQPERLIASSNHKNPVLQTFSDYPGLCSGAALSIFVMAAIFVNAVWYQPGKHPAPLFSTRTIESVTPAVEIAKVKPKKAARKKSAQQQIADANSAELLREVQTALSVRGYYAGKLDGLYGSRTKKAITSFQADHSINQDGNASVRLLTQILMSASARPEEVPVPKQQTNLAAAPKKVKTVKVSAGVPAEPQADGLVARIQSGLKAYGYDDLIVDGKMGQQTATAIQRFQLDYGMKITGEPSDRVLKKLREIGAYKQG